MRYRSRAAHAAAGESIIQRFLAWLEGRLPDTDPDPQRTAMAMLTLIEGVIVMDAVGQSSVADMAASLLFRDD